MKGHFTKNHNTHIDKKYQQEYNISKINKTNAGTAKNIKQNLNPKQHQIKPTDVLNPKESLNIHHATVERGQWQHVKQRKRKNRNKNIEKHPSKTHNSHQIESICPKSGTSRILETRNRFNKLKIKEGREKGEIDKGEEEEKIITKQIQSSINYTPKRKTK